jgi:hypothetical protein
MTTKKSSNVASPQLSSELSSFERQQKGRMLGMQENTAASTAASVNPMLEKYYNPLEWKRGQTLQRTSDTTSSFNNALANQRLRARTAGFGYEQPAEQMGETNVENARAAALSRIPGDVEAESVPIAMNALQARTASGAQEAGTYGSIAGQYKPETYYGYAIQQEEAAKDRELQEKLAEEQRKSGLWNSIIGGVTGIGSKILGF